ncbi:hypothetical protein [Streptomyces montanisoli]|uniref:LigA protein n=1 Tax=Streptomyces montanisoli TaxID=2798581 RepID=A0A940MG47_9ACTN|nr:hypothetical protein [Streptomyces montanisoli]MBP0458982.1 hypothetical protein [Streptomyces montanisoli]
MDDERDVGYKPLISIHQRLADNNGVNIGLQINQAINRLRGDLLPPEWITERLATYEQPVQEKEELHRILTQHHVLVLHAPDHPGRYTAALAALHRKVGDNIRHVRREPGEAFSAEGLEDHKTGWILDLRDEGNRLPSGVGPALLEDAPHLADCGSYLAVLAATEPWRHASKGTDRLAHRLPLPPPEEVLRAHLERTPPPVKSDRWIGASEVTAGIKDGPPAKVARWAEAIREAECLDLKKEKPFKDLVHEVVQAVEDWRAELLDWHTRHEDSAHRNYLLAAAVLNGAPVETVYGAADTLAQALGESPPPRHGQQGLGVIALTDAIDAYVTDDDTLRFRRIGYGEAVVDYFWADRPHLIKRFTHWTADQTGNKDLPDDVANQLADRVTTWALQYMRAKHGRRATQLLRDIAGQWSTSLPEQARDLLTVAAVDTGTGRRVRDAYLAWARRSDRDVPPRLKTALARACERLADVYPTMMLLRLTELAAHTEDEDVTDAVGHALTVLWDQPTSRSEIQDQLDDWSRSPEAGRRTAAHHAFLHLAARTTEDGRPVLLVAAHEDKSQAWQTARWRDLLLHYRTLPGPLLQQALNAWMNAAASLPDLQEPVLTILQHAVYQSQTDTVYAADRYLALSHLLFAWAPVQSLHPPSEQEVLRDRLLLALRQADPAVPAPDGHVLGS